jgi:hypothetical protein
MGTSRRARVLLAAAAALILLAPSPCHSKEGKRDCASLGLAFKVRGITIPIRLRYSHNMTLPDGYHERNEVVSHPGIMGAVAHPLAHSIDLRILLGLAYEF